MGEMCLIFIRALVKCFLDPLGLSEPMTIALFGPIVTLNTPTGKYNLPLTTCLPLPLSTTAPLYNQSMKKL